MCNVLLQGYGLWLNRWYSQSDQDVVQWGQWMRNLDYIFNARWGLTEMFLFRETLPQLKLTDIFFIFFKSCFTSTETIRTIRDGGHLDFHTAPELWWQISILTHNYYEHAFIFVVQMDFVWFSAVQHQWYLSAWDSLDAIRRLHITS